jgi:hypothetical protein
MRKLILHEDTVYDVCWLKVVAGLAIKYSHYHYVLFSNFFDWFLLISIVNFQHLFYIAEVKPWKCQNLVHISILACIDVGIKKTLINDFLSNVEFFSPKLILEIAKKRFLVSYHRGSRAHVCAKENLSFACS